MSPCVATTECSRAHRLQLESCVKQARAIDGRDNEFKCNFYEIKEIEYEVKNSSGESVGFDTKEIELEYNIWFKYAD